MQSNKAAFVDRTNCISCGSSRLIRLSSGLFKDEPLRSFIERDPWGDPPLRYVSDERWVFVQCGECSTKFHQRILAPEWMNKCYSEWVTQESMSEFLAPSITHQTTFAKARVEVLHILRLEKLTRGLRRNEAVRLLDFGCGWGEFLAMCAHFGFEGYGVDFSPHRRKHGEVSIFPTIDELASDLAGERGVLHVITLFEVLEHVANPLSILKSLSTLLAPQGILVLETPDTTGVKDIQSEKEYRAIHPLSHINAFTPQTLRRIARVAGFRPIRSAAVQATADLGRVIKTEAKRILGPFMRLTTQQYFAKLD